MLRSLFATSAITISCVPQGPPADADKRVFETSQRVSGNLIAAAGDPTLDGPAAADLLCNRAANSGGLGGMWTAWISVGDGSNIGLDPARPGYDLHGFSHAAYNSAALDRIAGDGPWENTYSLYSSILFDNRAALVAGKLSDIFYDELGHANGRFAWTGTRNGGEPTSNDCAGWSTEVVDVGGFSSDNRATAGKEFDGDLDVPVATWTDDPDAAIQDDPSCTLCPDPNIPAPPDPDAAGFGTAYCKDQLALYCFED